MKLSESTRNVLKNFSGINNTIYIGRGDVISTVSSTNTIFARAKVEETFPEPMALYDLSQFLNGLELFENFDLIFDNPQYVTIKSSRSRIKYFYADESMIEKAPSIKTVDNILETQFTFDLSSTILKSLLKGSFVFTLPDMCLECSGSDVELVVKDRENDTSNSMSYVVGTSDTPFSYRFKMENIRIIPGDYVVNICKSVKDGQLKAAKFIKKDPNIELEYYIALEPKSWYGVQP